MSHEACYYVKNLSSDPQGNRLSQREKLLLAMLADYHNSGKREAWPSISTLAVECLMDERSTRRTIEGLEEKCILKRIHPESQGRGHYISYIFSQLEKGGSNDLLNNPTENQEGGSKGGVKGGSKGGVKGGQESLEDIDNTESVRRTGTISLTGTTSTAVEEETLEPIPEPTTTPNPSSGMTAMEERQERLRLADHKKAEKDAGKGKSMRQRQADRAIETFRGPKQLVQKESSEAKRFRENNEVLDGFDINPVFRRAILDTSIVMTKDLSHTLVSVLVDDLDPYPDEMIAAAFAKYRRSGEQFFPRSGTIIKLIEEIIKTEKPKESALERQSRENRERRAQNAKEAAGA